MKRREFINWVGLGWIASSLPVAIAACSSETTTQANSPNNSTAQTWQKVGTVAQLDQKGQLLAQNSPVGPILVVGTSKSKSLIAVNPTCTHKGCTLGWQAKKNQLVCPCHDAEFGPDGKVQKGPAEKPLKTFTAKIEGDAVLVKPA
jgi:cytochrome b6-f complex iron-sulfur subunit